MTGAIAELRHDSKGHLYGVRLAKEETELRLPPHLGQQLAKHLVSGVHLTAHDLRRALRPGEIAAYPTPVQVEMLTLGNKACLIR